MRNKDQNEIINCIYGKLNCFETQESIMGRIMLKMPTDFDQSFKYNWTYIKKMEIVCY